MRAQIQVKMRRDLPESVWRNLNVNSSKYPKNISRPNQLINRQQKREKQEQWRDVWSIKTRWTSRKYSSRTFRQIWTSLQTSKPPAQVITWWRHHNHALMTSLAVYQWAAHRCRRHRVKDRRRHPLSIVATTRWRDHKLKSSVKIFDKKILVSWWRHHFSASCDVIVFSSIATITKTFDCSSVFIGIE